MADKTDDLVIGVSTDMTAVQRALKRLDADIGRSSSQIERRFSAVGKSIDKAMPTGVQERINRMVGVQVAATKEWSGALADQGKEMEKLRARFSPMFSTITSYKSAIGEIRAAHRLGAISADEMASAIQRERQAALASIAAIKGRNAALADTPAVMGMGKGANSFNTANIAAQFQDIAVMAQMGIANPMTIALQQGTQLAAVFNQMGGTRDVIRGIGTAFLQIINPISLITVGTIAAGVAAYNYFSESKEGAEATKKALKEQSDLIQRVAQKWGEALPAIRAYADEQDRIAGRADVQEAFKQRYTDTFKAIGHEVSAAGDAISDVMDLLRNTAPADQMVAMQDALGALSETAANNKTTTAEMEAAQKSLLDLYASTGLPVFKETADAIAAITPELEKVNAGMATLAAQESVAQMFTDLQAEIGKVSSAKAREELRSLMDRAKEGEVSIKDLLAELARISGYAPDVSSIISAFKAVAEAATAARNAAADPMWTGKASKGGRSRYSTTGSVFLPETAPTPDRRVDPYFGPPDPKTKSGGRTKAPKRTSEDRFFEDIEAIKQRTLALVEERSQLGMTYEAQVKRKTAFDLEQKALKDVREAARQKGDTDWQNAQLTPDQIKQIDEVSAAYARQAEELRKTREQMDFAKDLTRGFLDDFVQSLKNGESVWQSFGNAAMGVLEKIADKLLDMATNELINGLFGGGGGGGLGSLLGGLGGGGGGFTGFEKAWTAAVPGLYATGTANTGGARGEPRGIVHGQEAVIPLPNGGKVPVQIQTPQAPAFASSSGNSAVTISVPINIDATGADAAGLARVEQQVQKLQRDLPGTVIATVRKAQSGNVKF